MLYQLRAVRLADRRPPAAIVGRVTSLPLTASDWRQLAAACRFVAVLEAARAAQARDFHIRQDYTASGKHFAVLAEACLRNVEPESR
jgi:hypothetical protein